MYNNNRNTNLFNMYKKNRNTNLFYNKNRNTNLFRLEKVLYTQQRHTKLLMLFYCKTLQVISEHFKAE